MGGERTDLAAGSAPPRAKALQLTGELHDYLVAHSAPADIVLGQLAAETARRFPFAAGMQVRPEQGTFLTLLTRLIGASAALEIGTFTGYSSICIARGLADGGRLTCCDLSEEWTAVARKYWRLAGVADRIDMHLRSGIEILRELPDSVSFDLAFIDADKPEYVLYWEEVVPRISPGGVILVDNTLFQGRVINAASRDVNVRGIRAFNDHAAADERVELVMLPIGDGLTMARKK